MTTHFRGQSFVHVSPLTNIGSSAMLMVVLCGAGNGLWPSAAHAGQHDPPVLSGTYVAAPGVARCNLLSIGSRTTRALHINQQRDYVVLRIAPSAATRVVHLEKRRHVGDVSQYTHGGLARWSGEALIVESTAPMVPLWDRVHPIPTVPVPLLESFTMQEPGTITYRAYPLHASSHADVPLLEVKLVKCSEPSSQEPSQ